MDTGNDEVTGSLRDLSPESLGELISVIDGVADLEVDLRDDGSPRLRVILNGSVSSETVGRQIRQVLSQSRAAKDGSERRAGLGRGLAEIIAAEALAATPQYLAATPSEPVPKLGLALVAVEEAAGGISVRAADSAGGIAFSPVEDTRSLNQAVVSAVGRLRQERPLPRLAGVEIRDVDGAAVLTVVLARSDGKRSVGAALVDGGMPFTLGRAVWEALASGD